MGTSTPLNNSPLRDAIHKKCLSGKERRLMYSLPIRHALQADPPCLHKYAACVKANLYPQTAFSEAPRGIVRRSFALEPEPLDLVGHRLDRNY